MKTLLAALALTVALPTLGHAMPPCRVSPRTNCTIDGLADERYLPPPKGDGSNVRVFSFYIPPSYAGPRYHPHAPPAYSYRHSYGGRWNGGRHWRGGRW